MFAPPHYLAPSIAGIDLSTSSIKMAKLRATSRGTVLAAYAEERLPPGVTDHGDIVDRAAVASALAKLARDNGISHAYVSLPESKSYLFETTAEGRDKSEWLASIEPKLDEFVPLPPADTVFDVTGTGFSGTRESVVGIAYARRVITEMLAAFDEARIQIHGLEGENFALARAILPFGDPSTVFVIDIGKTTTKLMIVSDGLPRFARTIGIGGHSFTLAVQKHFGVTDEEAKKIKTEHGILSSPGNEEYISAMLSTVSALRDEIDRDLAYWQSHASAAGHEAVTRVLLTGGNASLAGLPEYLESALGLPVAAADVFTNFASRDHWLPPIAYAPSLAYGTAIGLALRSYVP